MARLRPARIYRNLKRPFTRVSKYKRKSFVSGVPGIKIVKFVMGKKKDDFTQKVSIVSIANGQIRHNALEAARLAAHKYLTKKLGKSQNYQLRINVYPHHVMREHALATGAGADRFSTGMKKAFGKNIGRAAQIRVGKEIIHVWTKPEFKDYAIEALKRSQDKLPLKTKLIISS